MGYGGGSVSGYDQQQMVTNTNKAHDMSGSNPYGVPQHHQQPQQQAHQSKVNQSAAASSSGPYDQRSSVQQQQQQHHQAPSQANMDLNTGYKSFGGTPSSTLMDPALRNLASLSSLYQPEASYYDKNMPPAAHSMFKSSGGVVPSSASSTSALQQIFNNSMATTMAYNAAAASRDQQGAAAAYGGNYHHQPQQKAPLNVPSVQPPAPPVEKPKRGRKKKQDPQELLQQQQQAALQQAHQLQQQQPNPAHQGFQSYSGMKSSQPPSSSSNQQSGGSSLSANAGSGNANAVEPSAISLKTANVLQGSAFNFGPGPAGLGLPTSLYGENSPYLEEFRTNPTNAYPYLPSSHRGSAASSGAVGSGASAAADGSDKSINPAASSASAVPVAPSPYHQFLSHPSSRPSPYQFMNQLDPLHQQYMMLNQSLGLGAPGAHGPPGAYGGQPGAYHPALGMHKTPYDAMNTMNRPPWI